MEIFYPSAILGIVFIALGLSVINFRNKITSVIKNSYRSLNSDGNQVKIPNQKIVPLGGLVIFFIGLIALTLGLTTSLRFH